MVNWYMKGQSNYESSSGFHMGLFFNIAGFDETNYESIKMPDDVDEGDPFIAIGAETKPTWTPGSDSVEIGLWDDYRIKIDSSGIHGWNEASGVWVNLLSTGGGSSYDNIYYVATDTELDAAISDIETNNYNGKIHIIADLTNVQAILNDASASVEIDGHGHTLDANGDNDVITVTSINRLIIENCIIDCSDFTSSSTVGINIGASAVSDFAIIRNNKIFSDGDYGYGIYIHESIEKLWVTENFIYNMNCGIYFRCVTANDSQYIFIERNIIITMGFAGLYLYPSSGNIYFSSFSNNIIRDINENSAFGSGGIFVGGGGNFDYNKLCGNIIYDCQNSGAGTSYGIYINVNATDCVVDSNIVKSCKTATIQDDGASTTIGDNDS